MNSDRLREKNKVAFDTMVMIDLIESGENIKSIFGEWRLEARNFIMDKSRKKSQ